MTPPAGEAPDGARPDQPRRWRDWYVLGLAVASGLFCLGPSLVGARTLISVNFLTDFLPWSATGNRSPGHQFCQSDTVDSVMPAIDYTRHQIYRGHLGSWQSITTGGGPMSALPNQGLLDPLSLPYWILPLRWAPAFVALLCWAAAIGGTYLFLRRLSVGRPAATLAGFIFATSGFMVMWTNWPQTRTAALIPALFWATDRVATRSKSADAVLLGAVLASMLLGGFPAVTGYALYAAGAYFAVRALSLYWRQWPALAVRAGTAIAGLVLGGALSAVQILPFADFYKVYNPAFRATEATLGLPFGGLATTIAPATNGLCIVGRSGLPVAHGPVIPVELVAYVGSAALVLAVFGTAFATAFANGWRRRSERDVGAFFAAAVVIIALVGWVSPAARSLVAKLPVFSNNFIGRIRSVLGFTLAVLAALGFDWLTSRRAATSRSEEDARRPSERAALPAGRLWAALVILASLVAGGLVLRSSHRDAVVGHYLHGWHQAVWLPLTLVAGSGLIAAGAALSRRNGTASPHAWTTAAFVLLPVLVIAQGTAFFHTVMPGDAPSLFYPPTADHRFLAAHLGHDRFAAAGLTLYDSTAYYYGLRSPTGHEFTDSKWLDLLRAVDPHVMSGATNAAFTGALNESNLGTQPILDQMGVKYAVLPPESVAASAQPLPPSPGLPGGPGTSGGPTTSGEPGTSGGPSNPGAPVACTLPGGPIRGVTLRLARALDASRPPTNPTVDVTVTSGRTTIRSGIYLSAPQVPGGTAISVPVAGEDLRPGTAIRVSISASGSTTPLVLAAACAPVEPRADGLKLVFADSGAVIYQRLTAQPRIRWASAAEMVEPGPAQVSALQKGLAPSTVLLSAPGGLGAAGRPASVDVTEDSGDRISARVRATGAGYLVVADPMQLPGWSVTVDGRAAHLLPADYAMVAVAVPAGTHTVAFSYQAPGELAGAAISLVGVVACGALLWADRWLPRRRRRQDT